MNHQEAGKLGWLKAQEKLKKINEQKAKFSRDTYEANPKYCIVCQKKIEFDKRDHKFCSRECWSKSVATSNSKRKKLVRCLVCKRKVGRNSSKFCSNRCQGEFKLAENKNKFVKNGILNVYPSTLKKVFIALKGHKCAICGGFEWMGKPIPLVLDHIDGNSDNQDFDNIRVVCSNCDAQLPTYKSKNRGKGRVWRRKRYKEGKSY